MKVIDLLNKIANGEEVPEEFKYKDRYFQYKDNDYWCNDIGGWFSVEVLGTDNLNDKVEILDEEDEFIDIEEFKSFITNVGRVDKTNIEEYIHTLFKQQTALINNQKKIINKLKEEGK